MKTEVKTLSQCKQELTLTIDAATAMNDYRETLRELRKMAIIPGFRKGKAPLNMVEKMYGDTVTEHFIREKTEDYIKEALKNLSPPPVSAPVATDVKWEKQTDFVATFEYEAAPDVTIEKYENLEVTFEPRNADDSDVEKIIEDIRHRNGTREDSDKPLVNGDYAKVELTYAGKEEKPLEREVEVGANQFGDEFNTAIAGAKVGDEFACDVFSDDNKTAAQFKVLNVQKMILPAIDDEFAKDMEFETIGEMKAKILEDIQKQAEMQNQQGKREAIFAALIAANPFEVPASQVEYFAMQMAQEQAKQYNMSPEQLVPMLRQIAEFQLKQMYLTNKLKEMWKLEATDEKKNALIAEAAANINLSIEEYTDKYKKFINTPDFDEKVIEAMLIEKLEKSAKFVAFSKKNQIEDAVKEVQSQLVNDDDEEEEIVIQDVQA